MREKGLGGSFVYAKNGELVNWLMCIHFCSENTSFVSLSTNTFLLTLVRNLYSFILKQIPPDTLSTENVTHENRLLYFSPFSTKCRICCYRWGWCICLGKLINGTKRKGLSCKGVHTAQFHFIQTKCMEKGIDGFNIRM